MDTEVELGDDEAVVCPALGPAHGLGNTYVLPIPPPDDDIVDKMPVLRARVHPRGLVAGRKTKDSVCNQKAMLCAGLEKKQAIAVTFTNPMLSYHSFPGGGVTTNSSIKVAKNNELVSIWNSSDDSAQVFVELVLGLLWVC